MKAKLYYAHSNGTQNKDEWQTIIDHATGTAALLKDFSKEFASEEYTENLGLLHDIGKYQESFQKRLCGSPVSVEHSICGANEWLNLCLPESGAYCIAGHHSGLPDVGEDTDSQDNPTLIARLKRTSEDYSTYKNELKINKLTSSPSKSAIVSLNDKEKFMKEYAFFTRMMFSCLTDADFLDTEKFCNGKTERGLRTDFKECLKKINSKISTFTADSAVKKARNNLRVQVLSHINDKANIYLLNMPTGSGKTITSMQFALNRAVVTLKKHIIYVIPFTSIIEQNAKIFKDIFGENAVLEHHCNFDFEKIKNEDERKMQMLSTENWDADIIVTTNVQFFESIYGNRSSDLRKLHNIENSIIVFDEVHMLPSKYFQPCLEAVKILTTCYNCEAVFMTATMPDFHVWLKKFGCGDAKTLDLIQDKSDFSVFNRCSIKSLNKISAENLIMCAQNTKNALIIVNTRNSARYLYERISIKKYHLSTYMTHDDRERVLKEVESSLKLGEQFILVSTSLIEAGVDCDFDCVFRETAGLENLLQSAGRCNREGKKEGCTTYDFEFDDENLTTKSSDINVKRGFLRETFDKYGDVSILPAINYYFNRLYDYTLEDRQSMNFKCAIKNVNYRGIHVGFNFKTYADSFKLIDVNTYTLVIVTKENREIVVPLLKNLKFGQRSAMRKLQKYTISLKDYEYKKLYEIGAICGDSGAEYLGNENLYSKETGIKFDDINDYYFK